ATFPADTRNGEVKRAPGGAGHPFPWELGLGGRLAVTDVIRRRRGDLRQRRALLGADPDDDPVADHELRGVDHGRDLALPEQEDRAVAKGERLRLRLADEELEPQVVPTGDVDRHGVAVDGGELAAEEEERHGRLEELGTVIADDACLALLDIRK